MWSSRTPQRALQQTPRTKFRAPEHLEELSSSLQRPSFELPNTSRSSQAASQDRIPSSRTSRGAVKQPPRNEFRAPKQASQEESKQSKGKQASKQPSKQASNQTSKRANEQTSKRANEQASTRPNEQTSKQASKRSAGCPERLAIFRPVSGSSPITNAPIRISTMSASDVPSHIAPPPRFRPRFSKGFMTTPRRGQSSFSRVTVCRRSGTGLPGLSLIFDIGILSRRFRWFISGASILSPRGAAPRAVVFFGMARNGILQLGLPDLPAARGQGPSADPDATDDDIINDTRANLLSPDINPYPISSQLAWLGSAGFEVVHFRFGLLWGLSAKLLLAPLRCIGSLGRASQCSAKTAMLPLHSLLPSPSASIVDG